MGVPRVPGKSGASVKSICEVLSAFSEPIPSWLSEWKPGDPLDLGPFLSSRVVYYPFSGLDWQAIQTFGASGAAHCFVYADLGVQKEDFASQLKEEGIPFAAVFLDGNTLAERFGEEVADRICAEAPPCPTPVYRPLGAIRELSLEGPLSQCGLGADDRALSDVGDPTSLYACLVILSAEPAPLHVIPWPERLALLFIGGEASRTLEALMQQETLYGWLAATGMHVPSLELLDRATCLPEWVLTSEEATDLTMRAYERHPEARSEEGGGGSMQRTLYHRPA